MFYSNLKTKSIIVLSFIIFFFPFFSFAAKQENWQIFPNSPKEFYWICQDCFPQYQSLDNFIGQNTDGVSYWNITPGFFSGGSGSGFVERLEASTTDQNIETNGWHFWIIGKVVNSGFVYRLTGDNYSDFENGTVISSFYAGGDYVSVIKYDSFTGVASSTYISFNSVGVSHIYAIIYTNEDYSWITDQNTFYQFLGVAPPPPYNSQEKWQIFPNSPKEFYWATEVYGGTKPLDNFVGQNNDGISYWNTTLTYGVNRLEASTTWQAVNTTGWHFWVMGDFNPEETVVYRNTYDGGQDYIQIWNGQGGITTASFYASGDLIRIVKYDSFSANPVGRYFAFSYQYGHIYAIIYTDQDYSWIKDQNTFYQFLGVPQPSFSNLGQFKSDGLTEINESEITTEDVVMFQAKVTSPANNQVKLQVEVKKINQLFDENGIIESGFVASDSFASIATSSLTDGQYKWRARATDEQDNKSEWQEFGTEGHVDFEVKLVPLYTQILSPYPSLADTDEWDGLKYGTGNYSDCIDKEFPFSTIRKCGCAITSMVMLGRYYDLTIGIDNTNVNPNTINAWLTNNSGYSIDGKLKWDKAVEYLGFIDQTTGKKMARLKFDWKTDWNVPPTDPRINNYVNSAQPIVAYSKKFGHYFVIDSKISSTYKVKDPAWYNTKTLNDTENLTEHIRGYNNLFNTANLFSYLEIPKRFSPAIHLVLASPAELLITDSSGNRLGRNPITNESFNEIPDGVYGEDYPIVTSDTPFDESELHKTKEIHIENPSEGNYNVWVIGTGSGEYTVDSLIYDIDGNSHSQIITGNTKPDLIIGYTLNFTPEEPGDIIITQSEKIPPEAEIFFNTTTKQLGVRGIDNVTINPTVTASANKRTYTIIDEAGNMTKIVLDKIRQTNNEIRTGIVNIEYNGSLVTGLPSNEIRINWLLDPLTGNFMELNQKILIGNNYDMRAKYTSLSGKTEIKTIVAGKETKQTLAGIAIIKLLTKSGVLGSGIK